MATSGSRSKPGPLQQALLDDLASWGEAIPASLVAAACDVARRLDARPRGGGPSPAAVALLHGQYRRYLAEIRRLAPAGEEGDDIDEVAAKREERRRAAGMQ